VPSHETTSVTVRIGSRARDFSVAVLQQLRRATLTDVQQIGSEKGPRTWTGASLRDVVLAVDPAYCGSANARSRLKVTSQDGWTVFIKWVELCGVPSGGEALYDVKGCNMCHGAEGEGSPADARRTAPVIRKRGLELAQTLARLRAGGDQHGKLNPFTPPQLSEAGLRQILDWLGGEGSSAGGYVVPENRRVILLAYEEGGRPITGQDGLIQMVVGMDDAVGRFSHWVSEIEAQ
jgi:cytochrome c553